MIGASAGGVEALKKLVNGFPADLPASVFVVIHMRAQHRSRFPELLTRAGPLIAHAYQREPIAHRRIYVAPPHAHLLVAHGHMQLGDGPKEQYTRPAVDPLFRSAAGAYGPRVAGVILSGNRAHGTAGLMATKQGGGLTVVQDPR